MGPRLALTSGRASAVRAGVQQYMSSYESNSNLDHSFKQCEQ